MLFTIHIVALAACSALVACGGGGGGSPLPTSAPTTAPTTTPTPTPSPGPASTAQVTIGNAAQSVTLSGLTAGYGANVTLPGTTYGVGLTATLALSTSVSGNTPLPQSAKRIRQVIGGSPQGLAYVAITMQGTAQFPQAPTMTFTVPSSIAQGTLLGWALYDPNNASAGWQLLQTGTLQGTSITFSRPNLPMTFSGGPYEFALVTSSSLVTPTPTPSGTGILEIDFTNVQVGNASIAITVNGTPYPATRLSSPCLGTASCSFAQFQLPNASRAAIGITMYNTVDGSGPAVGYASTTSDIIAAQTVATSVAVIPVMTSFTVTLNPSIAITGTANDLGIDLHPVGATDISNTNFVDANGRPLTFSATVNDPTGQTTVTKQPTLETPGTLHYSGSGTGPATVTVQSGSLSSSVALNYAAPSANAAFGVIEAYTYGSATLSYYPLGAATPTWSVNSNLDGVRGLAFDPSGNVWVGTIAGITGFHSDGSSIGTIPITSQFIVTFDFAGNLYTRDTTTNNLYVYSVSGATGTLTRTITLPAPVGSAAVDTSGNIYVTTVGGTGQAPALYMFAPSATSASVWNFNYYGSIATDKAGDLFMNWSDGVIEWAAGTPISSSPTKTVFTATYPYLTGFEVTPSGDGCVQEAATVGRYGGPYYLASWTASGASYSVCPQVTIDQFTLMAASKQ